MSSVQHHSLVDSGVDNWIALLSTLHGRQCIPHHLATRMALSHLLSCRRCTHSPKPVLHVVRTLLVNIILPKQRNGVGTNFGRGCLELLHLDPDFLCANLLLVFYCLSMHPAIPVFPAAGDILPQEPLHLSQPFASSVTVVVNIDASFVCLLDALPPAG